MVAFVEGEWAEAIGHGSIYRYSLPSTEFRPLDDAGMWVSQRAVDPLSVDRIGDLPAALTAQDVDLRVIDSLAVLAGAWSSTLHASGIRLRNATTWPSR